MLLARCPRRASAAAWALAIVAALLVVGAAAATAGAQSFRIRVIDADGTDRHAVAGAGTAFEPAWSRDGGRIAFVGIEPRSAGEEDAVQIFLVGADGGERVQLTDLEGDDLAGLAWSPDGSRLAFAFDDPDALGTQLAVINADGSGMRTLAGSVNEHFSTPSWSPDGGRLTFLRGESDRSLLSVVNADGTELRTLRRISIDSNEGGLPRWSPDGGRIAYVDARSGDFHVYTIRPDGHGRRRVGNRSCVLSPDWRPDGSRLACVGIFRRGKPRLGINIVALDGRIQRSLPPDAGPRAQVDAPTWSPDGTKLTYLRKRRGRPALYVIGADGRGNRLLSARPAALAPVYPVSWSPDSARIAFGTGQLPGTASTARADAVPRWAQKPLATRLASTMPSP
jgi:Tol biopolymer transport system component